jgi:hypothetical protein
MGSIPRGEYKVEAACLHKFNMADGTVDTRPGMALTPVKGTNTHGRNHFVAHAAHSSGLKSNGCVVFTQKDMEAFQNAGVRKLIVKNDGPAPSPTQYAGPSERRPQARRHPRGRAQEVASRQPPAAPNPFADLFKF